MKKRIIIFGVTGNTGVYTLDYFLSNLDMAEYQIIGIDIISSDYVIKHCHFLQVDINNKEDFSIIPSENIYAVIDLIGPMPARMEGYHPEEYVKTNILGTFNIVQFCIQNNVDRFIYARSFCDILQRAEEEKILKVDTPAKFDYSNQHAVYAVSQISAVELIKCMHSYYGIKSFIFRLPTIYLWSKNDTYCVKGEPVKMAYRHIIDCATEGKPVEVWGDYNREKDMIYVKDFAQLLFKACFVNREFGIYNAGTGIGTSLLEQINGILEVFDDNKKSQLIFCPNKPNAPQYIMDIKEAVEELNYHPEYLYIDMLKDMKLERSLDRF